MRLRRGEGEEISARQKGSQMIETIVGEDGEEIEICPGLSANEIQIPYDNHHKVSSLVKSHQNKHNSVKYKV